MGIDAEVAEAVARLKREFVDRAAAQRIIVHVARATLLIAEAPHRSPAARIEPPRRRDVGAAGTDDRAKPRPRGNPKNDRNAVIAVQVERDANIGSAAPLERTRKSK